MTKNIIEELSSFDKKPLKIGFDPNYISIEDLTKKSINDEKRNNKKAQLLIEDYKDDIYKYKSDIDKKEEEIFELKKIIRSMEANEITIIKNIVNILDEYNYALDFYKNAENKEIYNNLLRTKRLIDKQINDIELKEIKADIGNYTSDRYHNPIKGIEKDGFEKYQIIDTIKRGYEYKDKIIREADVVVAR